MLRLARVQSLKLMRCASTSAQQAHIDESSLTDQYIQREQKYGAHNYKSVPVIVSKAKGLFYMSFGSSFSFS